MTFLEAARIVLADAGAPLHFEEIAKRALEQGFIATTGATPEVTMGSRLYTVTKQEGSDFERVGKGVFGLASKKPGGIESLVDEVNGQTRAQLHRLLAQVPPKRFEALIMDLLLEMGFDEKTLAVTQYAKDGGIDVVGTYSAAGLAPVNAAVQVKRWKANVQSQVVTQLRGSLQVNQYGIVITTSDFTKSARLEAEASGKARVSLIDGGTLVELLIRYHVGVVEKPLVVTQLDEEWWAEVLDAPEVALVATTLSRPNDALRFEADDAEARPAEVSSPGRAMSAKPCSVTIAGSTVAVSTWKGVLLAVVEEMAARHPEQFASVATSVHGKSRQYVAATEEGMTAPERIGETDMWIETNQSAVTVKRISVLLLEAFGYKDSELNIAFS